MTLITRRDVLLGLGGGFAGTLLTPVPWALLRDVAIWTQHRRALPIPEAGEAGVRAAACTLCPAGCSLRVRTVGGRPVFVAGERRHPLGGGACALGLALHHLAHHPLRLDGPAHADGSGRLTRITREAAVAALVSALGEARRLGRGVLVLDQRPGRSISRSYRELLSRVPGGAYATPEGEDATLAALAANVPGQTLGVDLETTRTLLSFGAPVLESWGRPGRVAAARPRLHVVQIDTWRSPSATVADQWIAVRPGAEGPLALGLARVLVAHGLVAPPADDVRRLIEPFDAARVASLAGIETGAIEALGRALLVRGPAVAIGGGDPGGGPLPSDDERAIGLLNVVLGAFERGAIVTRGAVPDEIPGAAAPALRLADVPDREAGVIVVDAASAGRALPWSAVERKLAPGGLVVSLSPFAWDLARHARLHVPAPAPLEAYDEVLPGLDAPMAGYALSAPLLAPRPEATDPAALLQQVARAAGLEPPTCGSLEEGLRHRVAAIHASRRGRLISRTEDGFREGEVSSAEALWQALVEGGCWVDDGPRPPLASLKASLPSQPAVARWLRPDEAGSGLPLVATGARGAVGMLPVSPVLTKLYLETGLRPGVERVGMNPATARALGLADGRVVRVESPSAVVVMGRLCCDVSLPPGCVALAAGPDPAAMHESDPARPRGAVALAVVEGDLVWRRTRVVVREA
jgi:anaerobic selenocysteine-containing dehydrogenase